MPKLKPDVQRARREHIMDAAEKCFAERGFHRSSIHDICREAGVSPGALYVYFNSKEALIAGIVERDRADFADRFATLAEAPDFLEALRELAEHYFVHEPPHKRRMCIEIGLESTRDPRIGQIFREVDEFIGASFEKLFQKLKDEGRIAPVFDVPKLIQIFELLGDGLFWRRAVNPDFDARAMVSVVIETFRLLLNPVDPARSGSANAREE